MHVDTVEIPCSNGQILGYRPNGVAQSITHRENVAKTAEAIELPMNFAMVIGSAPNDGVDMGVHIGATWLIPLNDCMRLLRVGLPPGMATRPVAN